MPKSLAATGVVIDGPLNPPIAQPDDLRGAAALILDALAQAEARRAVGAEVELVAEHAGNGTRAGRRSLHLAEC
jgi:hypothetical protein